MRKLINYTVLLALLFIGHLSAKSLWAQGAATVGSPAFDVVSIKPSHISDEKPLLNITAGLTARNLSVRALIELAYHLDDVQLAGGPAWVSSEHFDVDAKIEDSVLKEMQKLSADDRRAKLRQMVQTLLSDRFKLKIGHMTKELPIYELVLNKNGAKMTAYPPNPAASAEGTAATAGRILMAGPGQMTANHAPMNSLAGALSILPDVYGRIVVDKTGLSGLYDFTLKWTPQFTTAANDAADVSSDSSPSLFTALQEQLGLKLQAAKGPVDVLVIDQIVQPSPN